MNILASNDDGYQSEGIISLVSALRALGHRVLMVSPDRERSGASHSMSLAAGYIDVKEIAADTWICRGTPVDCIIAVLSGGVKFRVDAVVSGINAGCNLGTDIIFSGTAAAAREGALHGIPSIAFSLAGSPKYFWDAAASWSASHFDKLMEFWDDEIFINVNIPNIKDLPDEALITFPSRRRYTDNITIEFSETGWSRLNFNNMKAETAYESGSDNEAVNQNTVSASLVYIHPMVKKQ
ncbi:MAG: 5'/3'-nucleotidase SurE [Spirochaetaceae bacterium]|jgi:5'-nucleotidase|nr:5'/3'-nucleotidase SurE [Spirochaetaceae bacterium]